MVDIRVKEGRLDTYSDESLIINRSIAKIQDISKVNTDYSRSIIVPATPKNNRIFKHWYNSNIVNSFDSRVSLDCVIDFDGLMYSYGKLKLNRVIKKKGRVDSYQLDFVGSLLDLKEKFGDDKLSDLDFNSYNFPYTSDNILNKITVLGSNNTSVTTISSKRMIYDSGQSTVLGENEVNVYYDDNVGDSGIPWQNFKVSLSNEAIFNVISSTYGIDIESEVINNIAFRTLYLLLNKKKTSTFKELVNLASTDDPLVDLSEDKYDSIDYGINSDLEVNVTTDSENSYTFYVECDGEEVFQRDFTGNQTFLVDNAIGNRTNAKFYIQSNQPIDYSIVFRRINYASFPPLVYTTNTGSTYISSDFVISDNIPDITVMDYFKGIVKAFKLIVLPDENGNVYMDTINNYYKKGSLHPKFENYIDNESFTYKALEPISAINFKFEEPNTILSKEFFTQNNYYYGDLELKIKDDNGDNIVGVDQEVDLPFETVLFERIYDIAGNDTDFKLDYGLLLNESLEETDTKPILHYTNIVDIGSNGIKVINDDGDGQLLVNEVNCPTYIKYSTYSFLFNKEFNPFTGEKINYNLYTNYHEDYINKLVSKNSRLFICKAKNLPTKLINIIKLNDVLDIDDNYYRINEMKVNLSKREIDFELLLDNDLDLTYISPVTFDRTDVTFDSTLITFDRA